VKDRFHKVLDRILRRDQSILSILAVSGGVDSVVMTQLYEVTGRPYLIAHCNFQLRGESSDLDEKFVLELGNQLSVEVEVKRFNTLEYASKEGISIQMAARDLRYTWFQKLAEEKNGYIVTAHHANDVAETLLFNLTKGTGIAGLHGISEKDGKIIRPLLWAKKAEIVEYACGNNMNWREDQSNESEKYMRGIIRNKVIPELERVNPAFIDAALRDTGRFRDVEHFIEYSIGQLELVEERDKNIYIDKDSLEKLPGRKAVLYYLLKDYQFSYDQIDSIAEALNNIGAIFNSKEWVLNIDRKYLILSARVQAVVEYLIESDDKILHMEDYDLLMKVIAAKGYKISSESELCALDYNKLTFPLQVRNWQPGDYFIPLGMKGKKKVSDFLIDAKVPVNIKRNVLVLVSGGDIIWVIGYRIDERFKITGETNRVYEVKRY